MGQHPKFLTPETPTAAFSLFFLARTKSLSGGFDIRCAPPLAMHYQTAAMLSLPSLRSLLGRFPAGLESLDE